MADAIIIGGFLFVGAACLGLGVVRSERAFGGGCFSTDAFQDFAVTLAVDLSGVQLREQRQKLI